MRIAIDFDGTLVDGTESTAMRLKAGVLEAIAAFKRAGHHLILHSCRSTITGQSPVVDDEANRFWERGEIPTPVVYQWDLFEQMRRFLKAQGLWGVFDEIWQNAGKPLADLYIDDRLEEPDWGRLRRQYAVLGGRDG